MPENHPRTRITYAELIAWLATRDPRSPLLATCTLTRENVLTITGVSRTKLNGIMRIKAHAFPAKVDIFNKAYLYDMDAVIHWLQTHNPKTIIIPAQKPQAGAKPPPIRTNPNKPAIRLTPDNKIIVRTVDGLRWAKPRFPGTGTTQTVRVVERDIYNEAW